MKLLLVRFSIVFSLFFGDFLYGENFSIKDLQRIFNSEDTVKFSRFYKNQNFYAEARLFEFVRIANITWIVGQTNAGYISCPVPSDITKYDSFKTGDSVMIKGIILQIGHSPRTNPALDLKIGCYLSKI